MTETTSKFYVLVSAIPDIADEIDREGNRLASVGLQVIADRLWAAAAILNDIGDQLRANEQARLDEALGAARHGASQSLAFALALADGWERKKSSDNRS